MARALRHEHAEGHDRRPPDADRGVHVRRRQGPALIWLHRYAKLLVAATLLLVAAGGMVTSTSSGLSVPDWPTTYGYSMFSFPLSRMAGGIFYEHGHRLIASAVGFLTIGLVVFLWRADPRRWIRRLGLAALGAVILQGVLGGLTVLFLLPAPVSIGHAALAQLFFCLTVSIALFTSPGWLSSTAEPIDDDRVRRLTVVVTSLIYAQILLGATMRHLGAGLAIPDFPLAFGRLLPPAWPLPVAIHFAHRAGALVVTLFVAWTCWIIWTRHRDRVELTRPAILLVAAVCAQVTLGALVVLSRRQPIINTLHVATGAIVLGTSLVLTLRANRRGVTSTLGSEVPAFRGSGVPGFRGSKAVSVEPQARTVNQNSGTSEPRNLGTSEPRNRGTRLTDFLTLTKVRVNTLVVATTAGGYWLASSGPMNTLLLLNVCVGTALVAGGAAALNQVSERDLDRLMIRTQRRPLAGGRMPVGEAVALALGLGAVGLIILWITSGWLATTVALATFLSYAFVYTPLKRITSLSTIVGAVPGALPPLIGWAAARGTLLEPAPWALFLIGFFWQLPHILAIGWMFREDYARAGIPVLAVIDTRGAITGRQSMLWAAALIPVSLLPSTPAIHLTGSGYLAGALLLGLAQFVLAARFAWDRTANKARQLFYMTLLYLPLLWLFMGIGRR